MPGESLEVHVVLLDPLQCASKQPVSLISVPIKIAEAAINYRIARTVGPTPHPAQYAHRRLRGCFIHSAMLTDFMAAHLRSGRFVFVASLDIEGTLGTALHDGLMSSLWGTGTDAHPVSPVEAWLRG